MIRGLLLHPIAWILLFILAVAVAYGVMTVLAGTSSSGQRLFQNWARNRQVQRKFKKTDTSWAMDLEPAEAGQLRVQCRLQPDGREWETIVPASWLPEESLWQEARQHAEQERQQVEALDPQSHATWQKVRASGWKVIRLAEAVEQKHDETALPATSNRAGILKWLEAGLAGLHFLARHHEPEQQLEPMKAAVAEAREALEQAAPEFRSSLETTLKAHELRLAHLEERLELVPRVRNDLDCLQANLLLAADRLESVLSPVQSGSPILFSSNDTPLVQLDLPLLERLRAEHG